MKLKIAGLRPRPRVAILGNFYADTIAHFKRLFPTIWSATSSEELIKIVNVREIDLLIIGNEAQDSYGWSDKVHVICFSENQFSLPSPNLVGNVYISSNSATGQKSTLQTEEYILPSLPLAFSRRRETDLVQLDSVKGWLKLEIAFRGVFKKSVEEIETAKELFFESALIADVHTNAPLAVVYQRQDSGLGIAWLPNPIFDQKAWVEVITLHWAQTDRERFPDFGDWTKYPEWMMPEEVEIVAKIDALEEEKRRTINQLDKEIGHLTTKLVETTLKTNQGRRRLLTAQGDELVEEVALVFQELGFGVQLVDEVLDPDLPKREDIRLQDKTLEGTKWEAIVEVRGYQKSGGATKDLLRLSRFANLYQNEKGYLPNKQIYVVNGQIELLPPQRQEPLASASEDIDIFAEDGGIVISSMDLFKVSKMANRNNCDFIRASIRNASGRWTAGSIPDWQNAR